MSEMRAVVVDPNSPGRLSPGKAEEPSPVPTEALIRISAISLNRGEVRRAENAEPGFRPGWDLAGTVERPAEDGSGPPEGSRVVGFLPSGAWAELAAVPTDSLAVLPEGVSFAQAATLPVAGLTALYALEKGGNLLGRSALITGASGGAGLFGVQLARLCGAKVVAVVRREEHVELLRDAGAHEVVVSEDASAAAEYGPYRVIMESVGGVVLGNSLSMLDTGGTCVTFGVSAAPETTFDIRNFFLMGGASLYGFILFHEVLEKPASAGLDRLARLVGDGSLRPHISLEESWTKIGDVAGRLMERSFTGKAVLHVDI
ncbi:MAG: zinc-binding dehydrogenase [Rubrobacteraceae bacterium]